MQYVCFKASSDDIPLLGTKTFLTFLDVFFIKQLGGS